MLFNGLTPKKVGLQPMLCMQGVLLGVCPKDWNSIYTKILNVKSGGLRL